MCGQYLLLNVAVNCHCIKTAVEMNACTLQKQQITSEESLEILQETI